MTSIADVTASPLRRQARTELTKRAIMDAALRLFSTQGYTEAGIRDIATQADVNPGLVTRYFGSKLELFAAALEANLDARMFMEVDRGRFGERIAAALCEAEPQAASVIPMLIYSAGDREARETALEKLSQRVIVPLEQWFGGEEAAERTAQFMAVITGFYTYRLMLPLPPLTGNPSSGMREWLARTLQDIVDR